MLHARALINQVYVVSSVINKLDHVDTKGFNTFLLQCIEIVNSVQKHEDIMLFTLKNVLYKIAQFNFPICLLHGPKCR